MPVVLKKLNEQVMVITGATAGIGLTTARLAADRGARLVLVARNEDALRQVARELEQRGAQVEAVVADVANPDQLRMASEKAIERFGGFDTWVNNAGVSIFGRLEDVPIEDHKRLFETNFWGVVNGSMIAAEHLRGRGGAIVNLGSELSDVATPLQGMYSASKHAVKGFTDALRVELEQANAPVSVTLIKPAAVDTMFVEHARNYMDVEPKLPPPIYAPEVVAEAILHAARHPVRDLFAGGAARLTSSSARLAPRAMDFVLRRIMYNAQRTKQLPRAGAHDSLHQPGIDGRERAGYRKHVLESSLYTRASMRPRAAAATALAVGAALTAIALWSVRRPSR